MTKQPRTLGLTGAQRAGLTKGGRHQTGKTCCYQGEADNRPWAGGALGSLVLLLGWRGLMHHLVSGFSSIVESGKTVSPGNLCGIMPPVPARAASVAKIDQIDQIDPKNQFEQQQTGTAYKSPAP